MGGSPVECWCLEERGCCRVESWSLEGLEGLVRRRASEWRGC